MKKNRKIKLEAAAEAATATMEEAFQTRFDMHVFLMIGQAFAVAKYYGHTCSETCGFYWGRCEDGVSSWTAIPNTEPQGTLG